MDLYADDFARELKAILETGEGCGFAAAEVNAGNLHRRLGGYPGFDHRMPVCCDVMRLAMVVGDSVVIEPEGGPEASLTIRYHFPRPDLPE